MAVDTRFYASSKFGIFYNIQNTIIRQCNARNKYNTVTTTLFTDAIWPNKVKNKTDFVNSDSSNPKTR